MFKSSMFSFLNRKHKPAFDLTVLFHKECNGIAEHGTFYADHIQFPQKREPVRFAFQNIDNAPELTPELLAYVWEKAEHAGYIVHGLRSYATVVTLVPSPKIIGGNTRRNGPGVATTARKRADQPHRQSHVPVVS